MKMEHFWEKVQRQRVDLHLETAARRQKFTVSYDPKFDEIVVVPESTEIPRHIPKKDFGKVWEHSKKVSGDLFRPAFYQRVTHNASYILVIMDHFLKGANPT